MTGEVPVNDDLPDGARDDDAPLPFATWLELSAKRLQRTDEERQKVLDDAEIEREAWLSAEMYWNLEIARAIAAGDLSLSQQLAAACVRELAERRASGQAPSHAPATSGLPATPTPAVSTGAPATSGLPATSTPAVSTGAPATSGLPATPTPAPPGASEPAPPALVPKMATEGGSLKPSFLREREALSAAPAREVPFVPAPSAPVAPARPPAKPLDMGTAIGVIPGVPELPFAPSGAPEEGAVARAKQLASEVAPKAPAQARAPIGETEAVDVAALARKVLAFGPPKATAPEAPAPAPRPAALPTLTVEQYASLCVDLEMAPHAATEALRRYGVTPEGKRALDEAWSRVFAEQPTRKGAFEHAKVTYRAWLARGGR